MTAIGLGSLSASQTKFAPKADVSSERQKLQAGVEKQFGQTLSKPHISEFAPVEPTSGNQHLWNNVDYVKYFADFEGTVAEGAIQDYQQSMDDLRSLTKNNGDADSANIKERLEKIRLIIEAYKNESRDRINGSSRLEVNFSA
ncbi:MULTISPECIES: hypothetical protein [unclassified Methylobacterium]|uniref:hypothetical protein n=1 Tax=unclassified Methylobacterium TaxID=2615210 RepID=UPI0012E8C947|nr:MULTISPECIES: hypothetical protein [unclassified Methylobacterium]